MRSTKYTRVILFAFTLAVVFGTTQVAKACYSGLILIPTTDVAGAYTWAIDAQWQGYSAAFRTDQLMFNTEIGIGDRFEIGIDVDTTSAATEHRFLLNAKYVMFRSERTGFTVAFGVQNVNEGFTPHPYLVATKEWEVFRTHFGVQHDRDEHRNHWFIGVDRIIGDRWQVMADYTSGSENYASAGAGWMGRRWMVVLGAQWPNAGGPAVAVIHVVLTGQLGKNKG